MSETPANESINSNTLPSIQGTVKTDTRNRNSEVVKRVIDSLVDEEIQKRVTIVKSALTMHKQLVGELNKVRPDVISYDASGKPVCENYTKAAIDQMNQVREKINRLEAAFAKAEKDADYSKLTEIVNKDTK